MIVVAIAETYKSIPHDLLRDGKKRDQIYQYICERIADNQLVVSGIGFAEHPIEGVAFDKVINLVDNKCELLCFDDFQANADLLYELTAI